MEGRFEVQEFATQYPSSLWVRIIPKVNNTQNLTVLLHDISSLCCIQFSRIITANDSDPPHSSFQSLSLGISPISWQ